MADILSTISIVSFLAAGVFAALAIALWFLFKIPTVAGDLSGRNARKSLERMRKDNEIKANRHYKLEDTVSKGGKPASRSKGIGKSKKSGEHFETGLLDENRASSYQSSHTVLMTEEEETGRLVDTDATVPIAEAEIAPERKAPTVVITMIEEIKYIHTEEVI